MGRTKAQILSELKSMPLAGDQYRSLAMGTRDPRHRRGPQAASVTGQRYNQGEFRVDAAGRLNLRRHGIDTTKLVDGGAGGGTVVIPAVTRTINCEWVRHLNDDNNTVEQVEDMERDVWGTRPEISTSATGSDEYVLYHTAVPSDADLSADIEVNIGVYVSVSNITAGTYNQEISVFPLEINDDLEESGGTVAPAAIVTIPVIVPSSTPSGTYLGSFSGTLAGGTVSATSPEIFFRMIWGSVPVGGDQLVYFGMWLDYQTEAATITVT